MDRGKPRWIPGWFWPWPTGRWRRTVAVLAVFAALGAVFMAVSDRKDGAYWNGYSTGQRWVHEGGYQAHDESIAAFCSAQPASGQRPATFERGCVDGARNAMK